MGCSRGMEAVLKIGPEQEQVQCVCFFDDSGWSILLFYSHLHSLEESSSSFLLVHILISAMNNLRNVEKAF